MKLLGIQPASDRPGYFFGRSACLRGLLLLGGAVSFPVLAMSQARPDVGSCDAAQTTAAMRSCANAEYQKADAELNRAYQAALKAEDASGKRNLVAAEAAWIRFRDAEAQYQAGKAAGGTLAPLIKITTLTQLTEARITQLKQTGQH